LADICHTHHSTQLQHSRDRPQVGRVEPQVRLDLGLGHGGPRGCRVGPAGMILHFQDLKVRTQEDLNVTLTLLLGSFGDSAL
jgi:hypothetical protein